MRGVVSHSDCQDAGLSYTVMQIFHTIMRAPELIAGARMALLVSLTPITYRISPLLFGTGKSTPPLR